MSTLPIRAMVLYKHGVGFFVRQGSVSGSSVELTFHQDEVNDALKSLAVFDRAGGQVLGIHYQTPMDKAARLANSSIRLSEQGSLRDLLRDLRGRQVTLSIEPVSGTVEDVTGRVVGIDILEATPESDPLAAITAAILTGDGQVRIFRLSMVRAIRIHDSQSEHDLTYFLDTGMSEDTRRAVTVRLSEGEHDLAVYYVAPSPTWRVSYRVVAESDKDGQTGKALLQGWGLFDNRLEEDLEDVQVTLVAGQPISFIYELYASRIPQRPTIQDEARIAPGPVEFAAALDLAIGEEASRASQSLLRRMDRPTTMLYAPASPDDRVRGITLEKAASAAPAAAQGRETGEFFQYAVTTPVSVKRGDSALVPIIGAEVGYSRELLYNGAKLPDHPVAALRFANTTGLTLERGPVTVVEDGDYRGEAVVPFTKDGNEVYLPYAVELGVRVVERPERRTEIAGLNVQGAYLIYEEYQVRDVLYAIENTTAKPLVITIEAPILSGHELFDTRQPDVETAAERRWQVNTPARGRTEFRRKERGRMRRQEELRNLDYQRLQQFFHNRWLDRATYERLTDLLNNLALIERANVERDELARERTTLYERQEQLRANLSALQPTGQEAALRNRMLTQLEAAQNRLEAIDKRLEELARQIAEAETSISQIISRFE